MGRCEEQDPSSVEVFEYCLNSKIDENQRTGGLPLLSSLSEKNAVQLAERSRSDTMTWADHRGPF